MKTRILLSLLLLPLALWGQTDATLTTQSNQIKNETVAGANTATRVGTLFLNLTTAKGNKQEANTWTKLQTFTASTSDAGLKLGIKSSTDPTGSDGQIYHNSTSDKPRYYDGAWKYITLNAGLSDNRIPFASGGHLTDDADLSFTSGTTLNALAFLGGSGTPVTSANVSTIIYAGSAASGNKIAQAVNIRQSVASTGVHFGDYVKAYSDHTTGTINQLLAIQGNAENNNAGTVTTARGVLGSTLTTNGPITTAVGVRAEGVFIAGNATVTDSYGLYVVGASVGSGTVTNNWGMYQSGSGVKNQFEGTTQLDQIPGSPGGVLHSGTYTPTITAIANIDATTAFTTGYFRVGNSVTVYGQIDADATAAGATTTRVRLSLPVSSNFGNAYEAGGGGDRPGSNPGDVGCYADPTNDEVIIHWLSTGTANQTIVFTFSYRVI